jgi:phosphoribosylaminoimidazolecarboxamide formyltransferase/IMP cyclohydrolase
MSRVRRALLSVSDKQGLIELAQGLLRHGVALLSTGGTARLLHEAGLPVEEVASYTGSPEILDGRVKTLHPRIHAGLLARPSEPHRQELTRHDIPEIDLLAVNLYPFRETASRPGVSFDEVVENIDIGGPAMLRAAAKNFDRVTVLVDPADYHAVLAELDAHDGATQRNTRFRLACKVFAHTAAYDAAVANVFSGLASAPAGPDVIETAPFPTVLTLQWERLGLLRYGENPHQQAAFYRDPAIPDIPSIAWADVLQGKELSYNNLLDLDAALGLVREFTGPAAVIVKHNNPCGAAESNAGAADAYVRARACDPVSAFGGVVAFNRIVDGLTASRLGETFLECIVAPGFSEEARATLGGKKNLRLLALREPASRAAPWRPVVRSVAGGLLVQDRDALTLPLSEARIVTRRAPSAGELQALEFAWRVVKHVRSNAIVLAHTEGEAGVTVGIGAGQMSRVDSVRLAVTKAQSPTAGTVLASDAFFPFRDGVDAAAQAGVTAVVQPGGSVRDAEVIAAADEQGLAMLFTEMRHFKH